MIKYAIKDFDIKEQAYKVLCIHDSGFMVEMSVGMTDPLNEVIKTFNQAMMIAESQVLQMFFLNKESGEVRGQEQKQEAPKAEKTEEPASGEGSSAPVQITLI